MSRRKRARRRAPRDARQPKKILLQLRQDLFRSRWINVFESTLKKIPQRQTALRNACGEFLKMMKSK
ncbi:MAG: hypothetical protein PHE09_11865 [Oscillospiraceae bacterium]|nr:hypothetical protein [Oscillospiraceae bacterium]